jgi:hypothetical protein
MNAVAQFKEPKSNTMECRPGELHVSGKLSSIDKFKMKNGQIRFNNRVLMKDQSDDFAFPMPVDIVSEKPLTSIGEIWTGIVRIQTYRNDFNTKADPDTGEIRKIKVVRLLCYYYGE